MEFRSEVQELATFENHHGDFFMQICGVKDKKINFRNVAKS